VFGSSKPNVKARDPIDGKTLTVKDLEDWEKQVKAKHENTDLELERKKVRNYDRDKEQFKLYKSMIGEENIPETVDKFQELKYNSSEAWETFKNGIQDKFNQREYGPDWNGKFGNLRVRKWYVYQDEDILNRIDKTKPLREQAIEAHGLRNKYRTQSRKMMKDLGKRAEIEKTRPNSTFAQQSIKNRDKYNLTAEDEIYQSIIDSSRRTNPDVNHDLGL